MVALCNLREEMHGKSRIVALREDCLLAVEAVHHAVHLNHSPCRRQKGVELVGEGYESSLILLLHGNVRECQSRVYGIFEKRHLVETLLHHSAFVDDAVDVLRAFLLIYVHFQLGSSGTRLPVYVAVFIADDVVLNLLKLGINAHAPYFLYSVFAKITADGKKGVVRKARVRRIYLYRLTLAHGEAAHNQPQRRGEEDAYAVELILAAPLRNNGVTERLFLGGGKAAG